MQFTKITGLMALSLVTLAAAAPTTQLHEKRGLFDFFGGSNNPWDGIKSGLDKWAQEEYQKVEATKAHIVEGLESVKGDATKVAKEVAEKATESVGDAKAHGEKVGKVRVFRLSEDACIYLGWSDAGKEQ
jgi:hypothetical protein